MELIFSCVVQLLTDENAIFSVGNAKTIDIHGYNFGFVPNINDNQRQYLPTKNCVEKV